MSRRLLFPHSLLAFLLAAACAHAQTPTTFSNGQVIQAPAINAAYASKADATNGVLTTPTITSPTVSGGTLTTPTLVTPKLSGATAGLVQTDGSSNITSSPNFTAGIGTLVSSASGSTTTSLNLQNAGAWSINGLTGSSIKLYPAGTTYFSQISALSPIGSTNADLYLATMLSGVAKTALHFSPGGILSLPQYGAGILQSDAFGAISSANPIGTSGATVPLNNTANTWGTTQTFSVAPVFTDAAGSRTALGVTATGADVTYAYRANNLSDLASAATARTNLGVTATGSDTTYAYRANNLSDMANAATARTNLGLGSIATQAASSVAVTGGTINGTTVGASTAAAGYFTTVQSNGLNLTGSWSTLSLTTGATTADLSTVNDPTILLSGDNTQVLASLGTSPAGVIKRLRFASAFNFTVCTACAIHGPVFAGHHTHTELIVAPGDFMEVTSLGGGTWFVDDYQRQVYAGYVVNPDSGLNFLTLPPLDLYCYGQPTSTQIATEWLPYYPACMDGRSGAFDAGKVLLMAPGDTPAIELRQADANADGSGKPWTISPFLGAHISGRPAVLDGSGNDTVVLPSDVPYNVYGPSYLYQGFSANIDFPITQNPSVSGTGGALVFKVTPNNTVTPFQRAWVANGGNFVAASKAAWEACGATYPYNASGTRPQWDSPCNDSDFYDTPGWGNLTAIATDYTNGTNGNNAALAIRQYGAHNEGLDIGMTAGTGTDIMAVHSGTRTVVQHVDPATSQVTTPARASFTARLAGDHANVTGDGTFYTVIADTAITNVGGYYNTSTGVFTAPVAGLYQFNITVGINNPSGHQTTVLQLTTTSNTIQRTGNMPDDANGNATLMLNEAVYMAAGDTASVQVMVSNATKNVSVQHTFGSTPWATWFSGFLVG